MDVQWFPSDKEELNSMLNNFLAAPKTIEKANGIIVPHAGYIYSGAIAGKAYVNLRNIKTAVIIGPSHYVSFRGVRAVNDIKTPFGEPRTIKNKFVKIDYEHSVKNQIPFLQKLNPKIKILPLAVGQISEREAEQIAKQILDYTGVYVFSTDLSHFLPYEQAVKTDKHTIEIIETLNFEKVDEIDACGKYALIIMMYLCKLNGWSPRLIEYKNSGDITQTKSCVVGYASFVF